MTKTYNYSDLLAWEKNTPFSITQVTELMRKAGINHIGMFCNDMEERQRLDLNDWINKNRRKYIDVEVKIDNSDGFGGYITDKMYQKHRGELVYHNIVKFSFVGENKYIERHKEVAKFIITGLNLKIESEEIDFIMVDFYKKEKNDFIISKRDINNLERYAMMKKEEIRPERKKKRKEKEIGADREEYERLQMEINKLKKKHNW